jgi:mucin-19
MATLKNTTINDTGFLALPPGSSAQRPVSPVVGMIRYNTTLGFSEQYTADGWQGIAPPPVITSISPSSFNGESGTSITVTGANFDTTAYVAFVLTGGAVVNATTTTRNSSGEVVGVTPRDFLASESPATVRVVNGSGLSANLEAALSFAVVPVFTTAAGSLGTIYDIARSSYSLATAAATDGGGGSIASYAITSGAVPTGMSFNTSTAAITGTPSAVGSNTTSTFTVRATDNAGNTTDRTFTITVNAPVITSYTSTGSTTFTAPSGLTAVRVLVQAAGGGGAGYVGGGGGAGGQVEVSSFPVSPGSSYTVTVGGGGVGGDGANSTSNDPGDSGQNSVFGSLTAIGGGGGAFHIAGGAGATGIAGGCGGGGGGSHGSSSTGGAATQPSQPGTSGSSGFGFAGTGSFSTAGCGGGGGGGTAGSGATPATIDGRPGGAGRSSDITGSSVQRGGGGGGASHGGGAGAAGAGGGGAGNSGPGTTNTGGGGAGGLTSAGGSGGSGIVIVRY